MQDFLHMGGVCSEAIESENIVGYTTATSVADNNFKTVSFNAVGMNTADIQSIRLSDGGAGGIGWGAETFAIWEGLPTVVDGSSFIYSDASMSMEGATDYFWDNGDGTAAKFSIAEGQAVVLSCSGDLIITTAGQVPTENVTFTTVDGNNFTGNPFPAPISIQDIKLSDGGNGGIGWGAETFAVWEGLPTVVDGTSFIYSDSSMSMEGATDYFWDNGDGTAATFTIPANQGVVVACGAGLEVTIQSPIAKK